MKALKNVLLFTPMLAVVPFVMPSMANRSVSSIPDDTVLFSRSRIYWEYNSSANDLGVHVTLDGEDWTRLTIENPNDRVIYQVRGQGPYRSLGMTELFFEGAEPSLDEFPLGELLALFPTGEYCFEGVTATGEVIDGEHMFTHAIPAGPVPTAIVGPNNAVQIQWSAVTSPPPGFPNVPIVIVGYQVIVEPAANAPLAPVRGFQVTLPSTARSVTIAPEFIQSLGTGVQKFEVLAIEQSGNQTLTEGTFTL